MTAADVSPYFAVRSPGRRWPLADVASMPPDDPWLRFVEWVRKWYWFIRADLEV